MTVVNNKGGTTAAASSLRDRNKADKRERIRAAAEALFLEHGFDATTTQMVAERAGVAKGTVFLYAPTKQDLVALVFVDRLQATTEAAFGSLPSQPGALVDELAHVFGAFFALYSERPDLARLFIRELAFVQGNARLARQEIDQRFLSLLSGRFELHRSAGIIDPSTPAMPAAINAFAIYLLALNAWLSGALPDVETARTALRSQLQLMERGLLPRQDDHTPPGKGDKKSWTEPTQSRHKQDKGLSTKGTSSSGKRAKPISTRGASATEATKRRGSR